MGPYRVRQGGVESEIPVAQNTANITVFAQCGKLVRNHDDARLGKLLSEGLLAPLLELRITDGRDLVDQLIVEGDRHADAERKPR